MRQAWAPAWSIWRARRSEDPRGVNRGEFVASRMEETAGRWPTVMCPSAPEMNVALRRQRDMAGLSPLAVVPYAVGS